MNIRSLSNPAQVLAKDKLDSANAIKPDQTTDREGNGQQSSGNPESHRSLNQEELEAVIDKIRANEGIQKNGLIVKSYFENDQNIVKIESPDGKVVKRFNERDLYFFMVEAKEEINLVDKTA